MGRVTRLPETRLASLYDASDFGGEKTMRAKVIRERIDDIRELRDEFVNAAEGQPESRDG